MTGRTARLGDIVEAGARADSARPFGECVYAVCRSALAKSIGLGRKLTKLHRRRSSADGKRRLWQIFPFSP